MCILFIYCIENLKLGLLYYIYCTNRAWMWGFILHCKICVNNFFFNDYKRGHSKLSFSPFSAPLLPFLQSRLSSLKLWAAQLTVAPVQGQSRAPGLDPQRNWVADLLAVCPKCRFEGFDLLLPTIGSNESCLCWIAAGSSRPINNHQLVQAQVMCWAQIMKLMSERSKQSLSKHSTENRRFELIHWIKAYPKNKPYFVNLHQSCFFCILKYWLWIYSFCVFEVVGQGGGTNPTDWWPLGL